MTGEREELRAGDSEEVDSQSPPSGADSLAENNAAEPSLQPTPRSEESVDQPAASLSAQTDEEAANSSPEEPPPSISDAAPQLEATFPASADNEKTPERPESVGRPPLEAEPPVTTEPEAPLPEPPPSPIAAEPEERAEPDSQPERPAPLVASNELASAEDAGPAAGQPERSPSEGSGEAQAPAADEPAEPPPGALPAPPESTAEVGPQRQEPRPPAAPPALPGGPPDLPNPEPAIRSEPAPAPPQPERPRAIPVRPILKPGSATPLEPAAPQPAAPQPEPATDQPPELAATAPPGPPALLPGQPVEDAPAGSAEEDEDFLPDEATYEQMLEGFTPEVPEIREGDRRDGSILSVSEEGLVVDIGGKTEGFLPAKAAGRDFRPENFEAGQEIHVFVHRLGEPGEYIQLGLAREENTEAWDKLETAYRDRAEVSAKILERVKGGLTVDLDGAPAFLPGSQVSTRATHDLDSLIGQELPVLIVKFSRRRGNIVVSRRELLEKELNSIKQETLARLEVGAVVTGTVKNVTSYGAFLDLGGIDGLIHVTDISYGRIKDPSDVLKPGAEVTAKVIKFDAEKERVSLSLKDLEPDPWASVLERYQEGDRVRGRVASITDYGAFVELESGVEGLIHITEMTWSRRLKHPSKVVKEGEEVEGVVLKVQSDDRRISLSLKQLRPDPWELVDGRYQVGSVVEGRVRNVTSYGAFIEIEEGVDGLVHVSDLSWDTRVRNPKDLVKKGQQLRAVVLNLDQENRRMSLGVKQLEPDVWETYFSRHGVGEVVLGQVTRQAKFGAFVELAPGVEGLCHNSEMPAAGRKRGLQAGQQYHFEIIRMDELDKRIGLRCLGYDPVEPDAAEAER